MLKCLCGEKITFNNAKFIDEDKIYSGGSTKEIGSNFTFEMTCENCKKDLSIELSIVDKNWAEGW